MLTLILKGALLGLSLSMIIGPLFFTVMQTALEKGPKPGLAVAAGIWSSDILFVVLVMYGLEAIQNVVANAKTIHTLGLMGGAILIVFGAVSLWAGRKPTTFEAAGEISPIRAGTLWGLWGKGFLINTINPGTLFFWIGIGAGMIVPNQWNGEQIVTFFGSMLIVLALTDGFKIYAAKRLKQWLTPAHIAWVTKAIGLVLIAFGLFMLVNTFLRH